MNDRFQLGVEQIAQAALPLLGETKDINDASQVCTSFGFLPQLRRFHRVLLLAAASGYRGYGTTGHNGRWSQDS
jgi:hypothetical protein